MLLPLVKYQLPLIFGHLLKNENRGRKNGFESAFNNLNKFQLIFLILMRSTLHLRLLSIILIARMMPIIRVD